MWRCLSDGTESEVIPEAVDVVVGHTCCDGDVVITVDGVVAPLLSSVVGCGRSDGGAYLSFLFLTVRGWECGCWRPPLLTMILRPRPELGSGGALSLSLFMLSHSAGAVMVVNGEVYSGTYLIGGHRSSCSILKR